MVGKRVAQAQTVVALPRPTRHSRKAEEDFLRAAGLSSGSLAEDNWLRSSTGRRQRAGREAESEREGERSEHETAEPFPGEEEDDDHDFPPPEASQSTSAPVAPSAKAEVEAEASTGGGTSKVVSPKARKAFSSARENGHEHAKSDAGRVTSWVNDVGEHSRAQSVRGSPSLLPPPVSSPALDELGGQGPSMEHTLSNGKSATPSATHGAQHPQAERKSPPLFPAPVNSPAVEDTNGQRRPTSDAQSSNHGLTNSGRVKRTEREDYSLILDRDSDADVEGTSSYTKKGKGKTKAKQLDGRIGAEQGSTPQRPKQRRSNSLTPVSIQRQQKTQRKKYGRIPDSESGSDLDSDCVADVVGPKVKRSHSESGTVPDDRSTPKRRRRKTSAAAQSPQEDGSNVQRRKSVQSQQRIAAAQQIVDGKLIERQTYPCLHKRYERYPKCLHCIAKQGGDSCRFTELRAIPVDTETGVPVTPNPDNPAFMISSANPESELAFPKQGAFNRSMDERTVEILKTTISRELLPILDLELEHLARPGCLKRTRETTCRQMCDFCATAIFSASWICRICGREYCQDCYDVILTTTPPTTAAEFRLPRAGIFTCSGRGRGAKHHAGNLQALTRFSQATLEKEMAEMRAVLGASSTLEDDSHQRRAEVASQVSSRDDSAGPVTPSPTSPLPGTMATVSSPATVADNKGTSTPMNVDVVYPAYGSESESAPQLPPGLAADAEIGSHDLTRHSSAELTEELFRATWSRGEPLVVTDVLGKMQHSWGPEAFIERYGKDACYISHCKDNRLIKLVTVDTFFGTFGQSEEVKKEELGNGIWKLKDWPPTAEFDVTFPELYEDFNRAVPIPDYTRRDGVLNISSLFPRNILRPDLGPKMYNAFTSFEGPGGKGSTRLHMDMADAVNIMLHTSPPLGENVPLEHAPGVAAWDIFRAEDADKIRAYLREWARKSKPSWIITDDPIHTHAYYIDSGMRKQLWREYGVRSWRIYQRQGEAIFIPAGCAHQVCNLADCIKVAVDFVSPENVSRCKKLTSEFRSMTNEVKAWKEDVLQLKLMMWYAWLAMRRIERGEQAEMRTTENGDVDAAEAPGAEREEEGKLSTPRIGSTTPCASATGTSGIVSPPRPETQDPQTTRPPLPTANLREAFPSESEEGLSDHANLPDKASSSTRNVRVPGSHGPSLAHLGNGQVGAEGAHIDPDESEFPTATHASASGPGPSQLKRRAEDDDLNAEYSSKKKHAGIVSIVEYEYCSSSEDAFSPMNANL